MLILRTYRMSGGDTAYGVKIKEYDPSHTDMAAAVLTPTHPMHTRYEFAKFRLRTATGDKAEQCRRIMSHYNEVYMDTILPKKDVILTDHAIERAEERMKWNAKTLLRMANKAFVEGLTEDRLDGAVQSYIRRKMEHRDSGAVLLVKGDVAYLFQGNTLITVLSVGRAVVKKDRPSPGSRSRLKAAKDRYNRYGS